MGNAVDIGCSHPKVCMEHACMAGPYVGRAVYNIERLHLCSSVQERGGGGASTCGSSSGHEKYWQLRLNTWEEGSGGGPSSPPGSSPPSSMGSSGVAPAAAAAAMSRLCRCSAACFWEALPTLALRTARLAAQSGRTGSRGGASKQGLKPTRTGLALGQ